MATVNLWIWTAAALLVGFVACLIVMIREDLMAALVALEMAGILAILVLLVLSIGFRQTSFLDLALALAFLSFAAGLIFTRFLERLL